MDEKEIEKALVDSAKENNGLCLKFVSPSMTGIPDRIVLLPGGRVGFVEVKRPGESPRPIQVKRINQLRDLGFRVYVLDSKNQIEGVINEIKNM